MGSAPRTHTEGGKLRDQSRGAVLVSSRSGISPGRSRIARLGSVPRAWYGRALSAGRMIARWLAVMPSYWSNGAYSKPLW